MLYTAAGQAATAWDAKEALPKTPVRDCDWDFARNRGEKHIQTAGSGGEKHIQAAGS